MQSVGTEVTERAEVRIPGEAGVWVLIFGDLGRGWAELGPRSR
jgi:hypothetical protein